ncbi:MAG: anaerobic ribonucleoside-triphosphate reductase activating protein [Mogibacterium sp.]|nr:anaerobic ribonucleoside-triphosphate reductase activating protein [Mogibacterium sp.]
MKIFGLQKMTLLDFPGRVACTVFLGGCDFRCPFCHNFELVDGSAPPVMTEDELLAFLAKRRSLLDGVAVTGGEPCLHRDLPDLLQKFRDLGYAVKLDTNGNHPAVLREVLERGLVDYVAMDIKNSPARYAVTAGLSMGAAADGSAGEVESLDESGGFDLTKINESMQLLMHGTVDYEFRTTVVDEFHDAEAIDAIGQWIRGARRYYLQLFTDRDTVPFEGFHAPSREAMFRYLDIARQYVPTAELRGVE